MVQDSVGLRIEEETQEDMKAMKSLKSLKEMHFVRDHKCSIYASMIKKRLVLHLGELWIDKI